MAANNDLPLYSKIYDEQRDPFKDAAAAITLAKQTNRNVLIEIGGNWCTWCHKIDDFLAKNPDIYQQLHNNFVLLKVSVSDSNENSEFMKSLPPVLGYPHMYVATGKGKMILSKDTAEFLHSSDLSGKLAGTYSRAAWLEFIDLWAARNNAQNLAKKDQISGGSSNKHSSNQSHNQGNKQSNKQG
ncbi:thioredoxin family protein [Thalassotalea sp. 42_200_T64]|nr:thioredoxin family protein [Thalassotalea sp. 42_200_T64]